MPTHYQRPAAVNSQNFFAELKRRNVYKAAVAYGVAAWLLIQIATQVKPFVEIPNWAVRFVVAVLFLGLPIALVFAWIFELTPEGLKRTERVSPPESITRRTGRKLDFAIIGTLLTVIAALVFSRLHSGRTEYVSIAPEKSIAILPFENPPDRATTSGREYDDPYILGLLGHAYALSGWKDQALQILDQLTELSKERYVGANVHLGLGDKEQALRWLEQSYRDRPGSDIGFIKVDPALDPLRGDPRFEKLVATIFGSTKSEARMANESQ